MDSHSLYLGLLGLVVLERGVELLLSNRNARLAFAQGGQEWGKEHYKVMTLLHTAFLLSCAAEVLWLNRPLIPALALLSLLTLCGTMALRYWAISTLGQRWNTRVIVVPGLPAINGGPYRFLRHPNYLAVVLELAALPLVHSAWLTALVFGLANALLLRVRIRVEEQALTQLCAYEAQLGDRPRLLPAAPSQEPS